MVRWSIGHVAGTTGPAQRRSCCTPLRKVGMDDGKTGSLLYVLALVAVVVGVDVLFFRNQIWERLVVNIGIVLVFVGVYFRFLKRP